MIGELCRRFLFLVRRRQFEQELAEEMEIHAGLAGSPRFGNATLLKEESREMWGFGPFERLLQDLRYALRLLRKSPGFTTVAILSLALGIGANTAIFSLIDSLLLKPLPVRDSGRLVSLSRSTIHSTGTSFSYPIYRDIRDHSRLLSAMVCLTGFSPALIAAGSAERVNGEMVSGNFFDALGVQPYAGRLLRPDDDGAPGGRRVAVLSYGFWQSRFGGDLSLIGRTIRLNTVAVTVVGISPPGFYGLSVGVAPDVRVPVTLQPALDGTASMLEERNDWWLKVVGRLNPGVTPAQAEAELTAMAHAYLEQNQNGKPRSKYAQQVFESQRVLLSPAGQGMEDGVKKAARRLLVLMAVVAAVLLIACLNLANLLLARTAARQREIAVRLALGASRGRLIRQLVTESMLLACAGGAVGVTFAYAGARLLFASLTEGRHGASLDVTPDLRVLAFTLGVSLLTGLFFGLAPALQSTKTQVAANLKATRANVYHTGVEWRKLLVSAQVALSVLLLAGAALFLRSLLNLVTMDPGFVRENVLQVAMDPTLAGYDQNRTISFYRELAARVRALPGVTDFSFANIGLVSDSGWGSGISVEGFQPKEGDQGRTATLSERITSVLWAFLF